MGEGHTQRPLPVPGEILAGKYRVERLIGRGGMGAVFAAQHEILAQRVAIKLLYGEGARAPDAVARFLNEGRAMARIQDEHVARVMDVGTLEDGTAFMVLEYLDGMDLSTLLESRGSLPIGEAIDYAVQCLEGLAEAHQVGIVHRDIKPSNLFLARKPNGSTSVKILDFGISKAANPLAAPSTGLTSTGMVMGSPRYMSPEQLRSTKNVDARSDIWSLGVVLYELLAGKTPFDGDTLGAVMATVLEAEVPPLRRPDAPPALVALLHRCMARKPEQRFGSAAELAAALRPFALPATVISIDRLCQHAAAVAALPNATAVHGATSPSQAVSMVNQTGATWTPRTGSTAPPTRSGGLRLLLVALGALLLVAAVGAAFLSPRHPSAPPVSSASLVPTPSIPPAAPVPPEVTTAVRPAADTPVGASATPPAEPAPLPPPVEAEPAHPATKAGSVHSAQPKSHPPPVEHPTATPTSTAYDPSRDSRK